MDTLTYCSQICRGQCCYLRVPDEPEPVKCPRLADDHSCSVYERRFGDPTQPDVVVVGHFISRRYRTLEKTPAKRAFYCGRIEQIAAAGGLPKAIADNCCVLHPEILEQYERDQENHG